MNNPIPSDQDKYLTVEQVANLLQVHWQTILKYVRSGELKGFKIGRIIRIDREDLETFIARRKAR